MGPIAIGAEEVGIADAGGAMSFAGQASEAAIDMRGNLFWLQCAFENMFHHKDASAGGFGFITGQLVGWTGGEAEPAVDTGLNGFRHFGASASQGFRIDLMLHAGDSIIGCAKAWVTRWVLGGRIGSRA